MMDKFIEFVKAHKVGILVCLLIIAVGVACVAIGYIIGSSGNDGSAPETSNTVTETSNTITDADSNADTEIVADSDYYETEGYEENDRRQYAVSSDFYDSNISYYVNTEDDPLNIRKEPEKSSKKVGKVAKGSTVFVQCTSSKWGYVEHNGKTGWIDLSYCLPIDLYYVWITDDGERFHHRNCRKIQNYSPFQVHISDATNLGLTPCKVCLKNFEWVE